MAVLLRSLGRVRGVPLIICWTSMIISTPMMMTSTRTVMVATAAFHPELRSVVGRCRFSFTTAIGTTGRKWYDTHKKLGPHFRFLSVAFNDSNHNKNNNHAFQSRQDQLRESSKLVLAPMMDYTDRHFRHLVRLISNRTQLYTEMVSANAIAYESRARIECECESESESRDPLYLARFLAQASSGEGASVLQLGGSSPQLLYEAAQAVETLHQQQTQPFSQSTDHPILIECNYAGLNLNCGCPSPKVAGKGCFGAALMESPELVRELTQAMYEGSNQQYPISVKCRIGTDMHYNPSNSNNNSNRRYDYGDVEFEKLCHFIETVASDGIVQDFCIHARIAVIQAASFSPADNRKIPPLRHDIVRRLVEQYPTLRFTLNGGVETPGDVRQQLGECPGLAGVMVGRGWIADPWGFSMADEMLYPDATSPPSRSTSSSSSSSTPPKHRWHILQEFARHADREEEIWGASLNRRFMLRAIAPLFNGEPNAKKYRIALDAIESRRRRRSAAVYDDGQPPRRKHHHQGRRLQQQQPSLQSLIHYDSSASYKEPPVSALILETAQAHLSDEVLYRSPQESYALRLWQQEQLQKHAVGKDFDHDQNRHRSVYIAQWQQERKATATTSDSAATNSPMIIH